MATRLEVVVRSIHTAGCSNPFTSGDPRLNVAFLENTPGAEASPTSDPERSPPDAICEGAMSIYTTPSVARSKLTNEYLAAQLQTVSTMRNWRTVLILLDS